jgi:isocitrate dehydrogenase
MFAQSPRITYTKTDEAPALATHSLIPIVKAFLKPANIEVETKNISLCSRILAAFNDILPEELRVSDDLEYLSKLVLKPEANIIKLPNISASIPQLKAAILELQKAGYPLPNYPVHPQNKDEEAVKKKYDKIKGSAVNPVIREGNADRRTAAAVKSYARKHPHYMGPWSNQSKTKVVSMQQNDFYGTEQSITLRENKSLMITFTSEDGISTTVKAFTASKGDIIDIAILSEVDLLTYIHNTIELAKKENLLLSVHLKATMMKVTDPVIFGHILKAYFSKVFEAHQDEIASLNFNPNTGLNQLLMAIEKLSLEKKETILNAIQKQLSEGPQLAMVDHERGITNLHVPSDVIIDASMPAMIKNSGKMWDRQGNLGDTLAMIPDRTYAGLYQQTIAFCKENGAFDPRTMGSVSNVGLMAQKAEEYGSHDKTFEATSTGIVQVVDELGNILLKQEVQRGDLFRACHTTAAAIEDWIKLAITRARLTKKRTIFWLDENRSHDRMLQSKVYEKLNEADTSEMDICVKNMPDAIQETLERTADGLDTIAVTGNVLRDYITDLFPILELGTSAKMLSIVPLMNGGGLFETGAGGSAPKHVQQLLQENHLRWDSLGEFLALGVSLEHIGLTLNYKPAVILANTLNTAIENLLDSGKSPSRNCGEIDNRGSHFYLALYWAKALGSQTEDLQLKKQFQLLHDLLSINEKEIHADLIENQGQSVDLIGYYCQKPEKVESVMRPSAKFNEIIAQFTSNRFN